jgi:biopolymer transport protein ExbD
VVENTPYTIISVDKEIKFQEVVEVVKKTRKKKGDV